MDTPFTLRLKRGAAGTGREHRLHSALVCSRSQHNTAKRRDANKEETESLTLDTRIFTDEMTGWQGCALNNGQGDR